MSGLWYGYTEVDAREWSPSTESRLSQAKDRPLQAVTRPFPSITSADGGALTEVCGQRSVEEKMFFWCGGSTPGSQQNSGSATARPCCSRLRSQRGVQLRDRAPCRPHAVAILERHRTSEPSQVEPLIAARFPKSYTSSVEVFRPLVPVRGGRKKKQGRRQENTCKAHPPLLPLMLTSPGARTLVASDNSTKYQSLLSPGLT